MESHQRTVAIFVLGCITSYCVIGFIETFTLATTGRLAFRWVCGIGGVASLVISVILIFFEHLIFRRK
jgi:hypothetical protein